METNIEQFVKKIPQFNELSSGEIIPYIIYYLNTKNNCEATKKMIDECFEQLAIIPYSNIYHYLNQKSKGKKAILIKKKIGYVLTRQKNEEIANNMVDSIEYKQSNELIDFSIVEDAPYYIKKIIEEMCGCYDNNLCNSCLVMLRKLFETLIIECYERHGISNKIKNEKGNFLYLSELIPLFLKENHWSLSRNFEKNIKIIKKYGDLSAHNRRFLAKKKEIDEFKFELRQCLQEIILIIDYPNWNRKNPVSMNIV